MKKITMSVLIAFIALIALSQFATAQNDKPQPDRPDKPDTNKVLLLGPKFKSFIGLTEEQGKVINPLVEKISTMMKEQREKMEAIRAKRQAGEQMDQDEMMKMREQREKDIATIKGYIEDIKKELTKEQLEKFKNVQLPNLEPRRRGPGPGRN